MEIEKITVLGSGIMGHGIAQTIAMSGYNVVLRDVEKKILDKAMNNIKWSLNQLTKKGKLTEQDRDNIYSRIHPIVNLNDAVKKCDLIIEAVPEIMDLKKKVYEELEKLVDHRTIFASNTSSLPITEIANVTNRSEKVIGIHFFNPPQLMKLVEIIPGQKTGNDVVDKITRFVLSLKKEPVICHKDVPGFIVNRLFIPLVHESCNIMERQSNSIMEIDSAVKFKLGFPMGIFELADFTGIDVIHKATMEIQSRDKKLININKKIKKLYEQNKLGRKTNEGFYKYNKEKYTRIQLTESLAKKFDPIQIIANIFNNMIWLISNNVSNIYEIEKSARLGLGLRISIMDTVKMYGISNITNELNNLSKQYGDVYKPNKLPGNTKF